MVTLHRTCCMKVEWSCSVFHLISGSGTPVTWHSNVRFPPSLMVSTGAMMDTSGTSKQWGGGGVPWRHYKSRCKSKLRVLTCTYCSSPSRSCRVERCCHCTSSSAGCRCRLASSSATAAANAGHTSRSEGYPSEP